MVSRQARLALLALAATAFGCRAGGVGNLARPEPPIAARPTPSADAIVARINQNARLVKTLKARPSITVILDRREKHPLNGRLAMERPRNFRLELTAPVSQSREADIGSNDDGFWFWVSRSEDKKVYVSTYDESGASPLAAAFQPDWIVEALGLREFPEDEISAMTVTRGTGADAGQLYLSRRQRTANNQIFTRMLVVEESSGRVREHRLYEGDRKTLVARATIPLGNYEPVPLSEGSSTDGATASRTVVLPKRIVLEWMREQLALDVVMKSPQLNGTLAQAVFVEPEFPGYARIDISKQPGLANGPTTIRETRPAPPTGVRLERPEPLGSSARPELAPGDPWPLAPDPSAAAREPVIGALWPTAPAPAFLRPGGSGWRDDERSFER
jgi:hypothetical protein